MQPRGQRCPPNCMLDSSPSISLSVIIAVPGDLAWSCQRGGVGCSIYLEWERVIISLCAAVVAGVVRFSIDSQSGVTEAEVDTKSTSRALDTHQLIWFNSLSIKLCSSIGIRIQMKKQQQFHPRDCRLTMAECFHKLDKWHYLCFFLAVCITDEAKETVTPHADGLNPTS